MPKHILLPKDQATEIMKKLGIDTEHLPQITKNDPVIKPIKAKKGDIVKIIRDSKTAGKTVYYRIVG